MGLRGTVLGIAVAQIIVSSSVSALIWVEEERIRQLDRKVLGAMTTRVRSSPGLKRWDSNASFMDL